MKKIIELTCHRRNQYEIIPRIVPLKQADGKEYLGLCTGFSSCSSSGSYIDFPGHIDITENGVNAGTVDILEYYRRKAYLVRPELNAAGGITAQALQDACKDMPGDVKILIVDGCRLQEDIDPAAGQSYFELETADVLADMHLTCLVADSYEKKNYEGVFYQFFQRGLPCVCAPCKLWLLPEKTVFTLSVIFLPVNGAVQTPCRLIAELE